MIYTRHHSTNKIVWHGAERRDDGLLLQSAYMNGNLCCCFVESTPDRQTFEMLVATLQKALPNHLVHFEGNSENTRCIMVDVADSTVYVFTLTEAAAKCAMKRVYDRLYAQKKWNIDEGL